MLLLLGLPEDENKGENKGENRKENEERTTENEESRENSRENSRANKTYLVAGSSGGAHLSLALFGRGGHFEGESGLTKAQIFGGNETGQKDVDSIADTVREGDHSVDTGCAVENANEVREIVQHRQIVLDANDVAFRREKRADAESSVEPLFDVEIRRRLVEHVHLCVLHTDHSDGKALQLSSRQDAEEKAVSKEERD